MTANGANVRAGRAVRVERRRRGDRRPASTSSAGRAARTSATSGPRTGPCWRRRRSPMRRRSGWQQVSFSSPVSILANTIYTVSYDTGSPLFYFDSGYFASGGVTNGNLTAPRLYHHQQQGPRQRGVQLRRGLPDRQSILRRTSGWMSRSRRRPARDASVKTAAVAASTSGSAAVAIGQSGYTITSAGSATPAGPMGAVPGSQGTSSSTARRPSVSFSVVSYRPVVRQARVPVLWGQKATSLLS